MTNVLVLPAFASSTSFTIARNGDWLDSIFFSAPGSLATPLNMTGAITTGSNQVLVATTAGLLPGLPIVEVPGIPAGAYVGAITTAAFTMVNASGAAVNATITDTEAALVFEPLPLDLTGIEFAAQLRAEVGSPDVYLQIGTSNETLLNGGATGALGFNVGSSLLTNITPGTYYIDILAIADGHTINMFPEGPGTVVLTEGITDAT